MVSDLIQQLLSFDTVGVYSHIRPDGDCIGAQVAMCRWLEANGVKAYAFNDDAVPVNLQWLTQYYPIHPPKDSAVEECEAFLVLDGNTPHRFGSYEEVMQDNPRPTFMVDHHPMPEDHFDLSISVEDASSTCELIFHVFLQHDITQLDKQSAKSLYTGLLTDTGSLQYDSVTPETLTVASELLRRGKFRPNEVAEKVFSNKRLNTLHLLGQALKTIELHEDNEIATMYVTSQMLEDTNTTNDDCEGFVAYPLSVRGIKAAILFKDLGEGIKMSLRSKSDVDVNVWARELGGGGHKKASGAWDPGPLQETIKKVVKIGAKQLKRSEAKQQD
jgi:phosphoesterase RecJ-like protein